MTNLSHVKRHSRKMRPVPQRYGKNANRAEALKLAETRLQDERASNDEFDFDKSDVSEYADELLRQQKKNGGNLDANIMDADIILNGIAENIGDRKTRVKKQPYTVSKYYLNKQKEARERLGIPKGTFQKFFP